MSGLPNELDPIKACQANQVLEGDLPSSALTRIEGVKTVHYCLSFSLGEKSDPVLTLDLQAECTLECQRCNQPMVCQIDEHIKLEELEIFDPAVVIEDELILALPMIPMHQEKDCAFSQNKAYYAAELEINTYKPFADLGKTLTVKE